MLDKAAVDPPGTDPGTRRKGASGDGSTTVVIDAGSGHGSDHDGDNWSLDNIGHQSNLYPDSSDRDSLPVDSVGVPGDEDDDDQLPAGDADEQELSFSADSKSLDALDVDVSPWVPLLGMLDSTEPDALAGYRPFAPAEGVEKAHALEFRSESMLHYAARGARRTGELDRTEVGLSDDNRDVIAGRDQVEVDGMLDEHMGHGLVHVADEVELNVGGPLRMEARLDDNIIMAGAMTDEFAGGTLVAAAMSDDMAAGVGLRCTAPIDLWVHGLTEMEERPGTCAADVLLFELAGTLYEREYVSSVHGAAVMRHQGTIATTMKTGFRPLMKTAIGVRNLIPGGGGGGAGASPPAAPPPAPAGGEAAGAATLTAVESGGALGRGVADSGDTEEVVTIARAADSVPEAAEVENLQHPATTADNLDNLARVDAEGGGTRQVAEIYDQPVPLTSGQAAAEPSPGPGAAAPRTGYKEAPPLDLTAPGAEGYDFKNAYGSIREQVEHFRADSNWRGNFYTREYLRGIDSKAAELFDGLGGNAAALAGDNRGYRTSNIYAAMEDMARQAEAAGELDRVADIRAAMDELGEFVQGTIVEFAARGDEFAGTALGSQRGPIDPNIDTQKLRDWLEKQKVAAFNACTNPATPSADMQAWSWTRDYYDQLIKALDAGMNPLAESSEQISFVQITKVDANADDVLNPIRVEAQDQLNIFRPLHDGLLDKLSDPAFQRTATEMGTEAFTPAVRTRFEADEAFLGPDSLRKRARRPPSPLDLTAPGAEGYDFGRAYDSVYARNAYYREEFLFQGNLATRGYLRDIDAKAFEVLNGVGGSADEMVENAFGFYAPGIHDALKRMAGEAEAAGDINRAGDIRAAMGELEELVGGRLAELAARTEELQGTPIDRSIDKVRLRGWMHGELEKAVAEFDAVHGQGDAERLAGFERNYWEHMIQALDNRVDPVEYSNHQIDTIRQNKIDPYYARFADEVAAANAEGYELVIARPSAADEYDIYVKLQERLVETLSDPRFRRSVEVTGTDSVANAARSRVGAGLDLLEPDSLRTVADADLPPLAPSASLSDDAGYIADVRDRGFSRSTLDASEQTLERHVSGLADPEAAARSGTSAPGTDPGLPVSRRRAPPDNAQAPLIDNHTGRWVLGSPPSEPYVPRATSDGISTATPVASVDAPRSAVSWDSGLQQADGTDAGRAAGDAGDADAADLFKAATEPVDEDAGDVQRAGTTPGDASPGSAATGSGDSAGLDANPTGSVSEATDFDSARRGADPDPPDPPSTQASATGPAPGTQSQATGGASTSASGESAAGARSNLYDEPVSFEGRSLEGATPPDESKEIARSIDGVELPIDDPVPVEPARKSALGNSAGRPVSEPPVPEPPVSEPKGARDVDIDARLHVAKYNTATYNQGPRTADSVWTTSGNRRVAANAANARWSEFSAARRTSTVGFSDDPHQILYRTEYEETVFSPSRNRFVERFRGAEPPNTLDRSHAARYVPRPRGWEPTREPGFGRLSQGWNQFPFSHRERIVNTLSRGEALSPEQVTALQSGLDTRRAAEGGLPSAQYRAMADMISDLGDAQRHSLWRTQDWRGERIRALIEMLDYAGAAV